MPRPSKVGDAWSFALGPLFGVLGGDPLAVPIALPEDRERVRRRARA